MLRIVSMQPRQLDHNIARHTVCKVCLFPYCKPAEPVLQDCHRARVAKRVNNGDFPYNVYDTNGGIVKPETKKAKKAG
jgi:hypothetical protein